MTQNETSFQRFKLKQERLESLLGSSSAALKELGEYGKAEVLDSLRTRVNSERLKVLVVGEFKRGKSTVINALLGQEVLPAYAVPCTAVINEIKYGAEKKAIIHFHDPLPPLPSGLSEEALQHINAYGGVSVPPLEVPVESLEQYVVIPDPGKDQAESVAESPFKVVEVVWPISLCQNGVEIIDSPGLNEHKTRTSVTVDYLSNVDAIVFVMMCVPLGSTSELSFIENFLRASGHEDIFFLCNRFDDVRGEVEREKIVRYGRTRLGPLTSFSGDGVFFISARDALDGRLEGDMIRVEKSAFLPFERRLTEFLVLSRGRIKLNQPAQAAITEVTNAVKKTVPAQLKMLRDSTAELEQRLEEIRPQVEQAKIKSLQVTSKIRLMRERLQRDVRDQLEIFVRRYADEIPSLVAGYKPKNEVKFVTMESTKKQCGVLAKEVSEFIDQDFAGKLASWQKSTLNPYIQEQASEMGENVRESIEQILASVKWMKEKLIGEVQEAADGAEQFWAAVVGQILGGPGAALIGAKFGFKEMFKSLLPAVAIGIAGAILALNPITIIIALVAAGALGAWYKNAQLTDKVKELVGEQIARSLKEQASEIAGSGAAAVYSSTEELQRKVESTLQREVQSVMELADSVLEKKRRGEAEVARRIQALEVISESLHDNISSLQDVVMDLAN